jgi:hypothetical protein
MKDRFKASGFMKLIDKMRDWKIIAKISFFILGIASTIWFLIRVIPKPSRATYPCMRAAAPIMSGFAVYLLAITGSVFAFRKFGKRLLSTRYLAALGFLVAAIIFVFIAGSTNSPRIKASQLVSEQSFIANVPIGIAKGLKPGRVVWVWDKDATDSTCTNTSGDYWFQNTDGNVVEGMLSTAVKLYTNETTVANAWDALFKHFNNNHGKGSVGYSTGEKICIKINLTTSCCGSFSDFTVKTAYVSNMDATPEMVLALLKQLINEVGVAQSDIYVGDPFRRFHDLYWNVCHSVFHDVNYMDDLGVKGRMATTLTTEQVLVFSDGVNKSQLPKIYEDCDYFINMPCLKSHNAGGITLTAKNHQGSIIELGTPVADQGAEFMHYSLPSENPGYGKYRHLVDYMGHELLGGKTLLFIVDGIWAGRDWDGIVEKWNMPPFNGDYPSSLFLSQDEVAIQSVCFDFLLEEYKNKDASVKYPYMDGADDFLYQAADPSYWPAGVVYDPEDDGTPIGSLGVYEHWNNAIDKEYTRNLATGDGIELISNIGGSSSIVNPVNDNNSLIVRNYPNPATSEVFFEYSLNKPAQVRAEVYSVEGKKIAQLRDDNDYIGAHQISWNVHELNSGIYLFRLNVQTDAGMSASTVKFMVE